MKKISVMLIALITTLFLLASCGNGEDDSDRDNDGGTETGTSSANGSGDTSESGNADESNTTVGSGNADESNNVAGGSGTDESNSTGAEDEDKLSGSFVKYDYDMSEYIKLPDFINHTFDVKEDSIKQAIGTYLMQYSTEYTAKRGDKVQIDVKFYDVPLEVDIRGEEITELAIDGQWIEGLGMPDGGYQLSRVIEENVIGMKIGTTVSILVTLDDDERWGAYSGKRVIVDITLKNTVCGIGDVVLVSYTGYYIDVDGNIVKEDGKDKIFDSSNNATFFLGSNLAIKDFENGIAGMIVGEERDIFATFPSNYMMDDLAGVKVMFRVKVKSVHTPPIYDDAFVQNYFSAFKTTDEFENTMMKEYLLELVYDYIENGAEVIKYPEAEYFLASNQLEEVAEIFVQNYGMTLDQYIYAQYGMTRDEYIKSNMKTEMIFYALKSMLGERVYPTVDELVAEQKRLIEEYKNEYMLSGMSEAEALKAATEYVEALGGDYIFENVVYEKVDKTIPEIVMKNIIESELEYCWETK